MALKLGICLAISSLEFRAYRLHPHLDAPKLVVLELGPQAGRIGLGGFEDPTHSVKPEVPLEKRCNIATINTYNERHLMWSAHRDQAVGGLEGVGEASPGVGSPAGEKAQPWTQAQSNTVKADCTAAVAAE